tara:strand:- start:99537 stop:100628 length:1092 start_codon:yes stop_codon:yes gene_type:complete
MLAIQNNDRLKLQVVCFASAVLDRFGRVVNLIKEDGFYVDAEVNVLIEGENPLTMAKSTGLALMQLPETFSNLEPDVIITVGDRYETMATALSASYMNIPLAHTMGGEVSGTIDESVRHAVTKFAHIHFPSNEDAAQRIIKMGEDKNNVHVVGCPRIDLVKNILKSENLNPETSIFNIGVGSTLNLDEPFLLVSQHPVTTEYEQAENQVLETLEAVNLTDIPAIVLWPNSDAGSDLLSRGIRKWRERGKGENMHFFKNLPINTYVKLMNKTLCLIGNSSSAIREGAFIGTPCVNIGSRQNGRLRETNVVDATHNKNKILEAINKQMKHGKYDSKPIYGDGHAGEKIAKILETVEVSIQKRITY